jgi:DNA-binding CsgD family transcriptional regulator
VELAEPIDEDADRAVEESLSPREHEVVELVGEGLTNVEIADRLYISRRTVESHVEHVKHKLGHRSRHQVMAWAIRAQLQ